MLDPDTLDQLAEARARIEAARETLQPLLDAPDGDLAVIRQAVSRLDRMAAAVARIEGTVERQTPVASRERA